jgi:hypothetical protein
VTAVGSRPLSVYSFDQVGYDYMGMELRISGTAGPMPEGGSDEAVGLEELVASSPSANEGGLFGKPVQHGDDRSVMTNGDRFPHIFWAQRPQQGDPLGCRERQVVAGSSPDCQPGTQIVSGGRHPDQQVPECVGLDFARKPEPVGRRSDPSAWCLTATEVVVIDAVGYLVEVVVGTASCAEPAYRQHSVTR